MGLLRTAVIGAAIYGAIKYITKKDEQTGKSVIDDLKAKAPEWVDKAKAMKEDLQSDFATRSSD